MKTVPTRSLHPLLGATALAILAGLLFAAPAFAQAPATARVSPQKLAKYDTNKNGVLDPDELEAMQRDDAAAPGDAIELSPFTVNTDKDDGFTALNAGTATRLALDMKDAPIPYSVMTRDFIDALGITNIAEAATWSTNASGIVDGNGQDVFNITTLTNIRGVGNNGGQQRNGYLTAATLDSYNLERYDFGRGPNAALFNIGTNGNALAGGMGGQTKRARVDREITNVSATVGSWEYYRAMLDVNRPLGDKFALRANAVWFDRGGWKKGEFEKTDGITVAGTWKISPRTELRLEAAHDLTSRAIPLVSMFDGFTGWDGVTVVNGPLLNSQFPNNATPGAVYGLTFNGEPQGVNRQGGAYHVWDPTTGTLMNWQNMGTTRRGDETNRTPILWNGSVISRNGDTSILPFGNGATANSTPTATANNGEVNLLYQIGLPADRFSRAINGSNFRLPSKTFTNQPDAPILTQRMRDINLTGSHIFSDTLYLEFGGDINEVHDKRMNRVLDFRTVRIDINRSLPNGAANPNFLAPYTEAGLQSAHRFTDNATLRANLGYLKNLDRFGNYTFNLGVATNYRETRNRSYVFSMATLADLRMQRGGDDLIRVRHYWSNASRPYSESGVPTSAYKVDWTNGNAPVGSTVPISPRWLPDGWDDTKESYNNAVLAMVARYFKNRLIVTTATRYDAFEVKTKQRMEFGDLPTNWDGKTLYYKPSAPADWVDLTFIPRNATGVPTTTVPNPAVNRPRINPLSTPGGTTPVVFNGQTVGFTNGSNNGVQIPSPFFSGDRFRNDYSPPVNEGDKITGSYGAVFHINHHVAVFGNFGTSYVPPPTGQFTLDANLVEPQQGSGYNGGLRFSLLGERLSINTLYYNDLEEKLRTNPPVSGPINGLLARNRFDDASTDGRNQLGVPDIFGTDYQSRRNKGYELEVVGQILPGWRVSLNVGTARVDTFERWPLARPFVLANAEDYRRVLEDAGGMLTGGAQPNGAPGIAVANPAVTPAVASERTNAVTDYNNIWANYAIVANDEPTLGAKRTNINVFSDYTIREGRFKGLRVGLGAQYRGDNIIGYRSGDTIVDPANPARAIDDPTVNALTPIYVKQPFNTTATIGYSRRLNSGWFQGKEIVMQLRIRNLLNNQAIIYQDSDVGLRPPGGANPLTTPNRVSVPVRNGVYNEPTSFLFTTTLKL